MFFTTLSCFGLCWLHFRGLGHPWVAFWFLWVPRLTPDLYFVDIFGDLGSLWAPKSVARAAEGVPKASKRVPGSYFFDSNTYRRKGECAESVRISTVLCSISDDFLHDATLDPLQPAQSKRCLSILTTASQNTLKNIDFDTISETFFYKFLDSAASEAVDLFDSSRDAEKVCQTSPMNF